MLSLLRLRITWAIIVAIVIAIVPPLLIEEDKRSSLLIGLVLAIFVLLFEIIWEIKEREERLLRPLTFGEYLARDASFFADFYQILNQCQEIQKAEYEYFEPIMRWYLKSCCDQLHQLTEGLLVTSQVGNFSFRVRGIRVRKSMCSVQYEEPHFWKEELGDKYLSAHRSLIRKRRVKIQRIWLQREDKLKEYREEIIKQTRVLGRKNVFVVPLSDHIPKDLCEDFGVIDDRMKVNPSKKDPEIEEISYKWKEVEDAKSYFERLLEYAQPASEYFAKIDGKNAKSNPQIVDTSTSPDHR